MKELKRNGLLHLRAKKVKPEIKDQKVLKEKLDHKVKQVLKAQNSRKN